MKVELRTELDEIQKAQLELNQRKNAVRNVGIAECRKLIDRKSTRLNSRHVKRSRMPSSA